MRENTTHEIEEKEKNRKVLLVSILLHLLIFMFLFLPWFTGLSSPDMMEPRGILVNFNYDEGAVANTVKEVKSEAPKKPVEEKPVEKVIEKASEKKASVTSETTVDEAALLAAKKEDAAKKAKEAEALAKLKAQEEAARKKAEAERKEKEAFESKKSQFSDLFGNGQGTAGSGTDAEDSNSDGDPDASKLDGLTSGKGTVGTGLGGRGIVYEPVIKDNSQKSGKVVIRVCVNQKGSVVSKKFTQKGSTTTDSYLVELALKNAAKYKFTESEIKEQCGDIVIDFRLM